MIKIKFVRNEETTKIEVVQILCSIALLIQLFKTERNIETILIVGMFMICSTIDNLKD
jgi:hypothetical protein